MEDENEINEPEFNEADPDGGSAPIVNDEDSGEGGESEYTPNLKFTVDKKEYEFDERVRGLITDKESEDYFRDIYTKAHGLDLVKQSLSERDLRIQQRDAEYEALNSQTQTMQQAFHKLKGLKDQDFGTFQKAWEIPDNVVLQRASEILSVHGNPEAQQRLEQTYADRLRMLQYEDRVNNESQTSQAMRMQLHEMKMHSALSQPDVSSFASEYDRRVGQPGAFQEEVNRIGTIAFHSGKGYEDPKVVVAQAKERLSKLMGPLTPALNTPSKAPAAREKAAPTAAPLPNMGSGRAGTVTKKRITSTDDLRKLAASMR
jgi:hypothetical protein